MKKKTPKPYWEAEVSILTFRSNSPADAFRKVADYIDAKDLGMEDICEISCNYITDATVEDDENYSISITV